MKLNANFRKRGHGNSFFWGGGAEFPVHMTETCLPVAKIVEGPLVAERLRTTKTQSNFVFTLARFFI